MWSWRWVKRTIDLAAEHGLNAVVFHRNDVIDMLVFPQRYFDVSEIWAVATQPSRVQIRKARRTCSRDSPEGSVSGPGFPVSGFSRLTDTR